MPEININGTPGGGQPSGAGPSRPFVGVGTVSDNARRATDFEAAKNASESAARAASAASDAAFRAAERQRNQQNNQTARDAQNKRNQEEAAFRRRDTEEKRRRQQEDKLTREEMAQRQREMSDRVRAHRQFTSQNNKRLHQEQMIIRQFENLQSRSSATQSPATYRAIQRASGNLNARVDDYRRRFGRTPFGVDATGIAGIIGGMGSFENTYASQNVARLGHLGGRAADNRDYRELVRIEHELKRIESVNLKQLGVHSKATQEEKINAQRNLAAIREARSRIAVGRSGSSRMMNMAGNLIGGASLIASNPYVDLALTAAAFTVGLPFTTNAAMGKAMSLSAPYTNFRQGAAGIARGGNFRSINLQNMIFQRGPASAMQKALGMTPMDTLRILGQYGISPTSSEQANDIANEIRTASFQPMMGLNDNQLAQGLRLARTLGVTGGGLNYAGSAFRSLGSPGGVYSGTTSSTNSDKYFEKLRTVMTTATREGLDHSTVAAGFNNLLTIGARAGAVNVNAGAIANFQSRMMSSGLPSMRSGEGIAAALSGMNTAIGKTGVGGAPAQNLMFMSYFKRHGGMPKSTAALAKFLGWSPDQLKQNMSNPVTAEMIKNYLGAAQSGNDVFALTYLQPFMMDNPDTMMRVFNGSAFGNSSPLYKDLLLGSMTGLGYGGGLALKYGKAPAVAPGKISFGTAPIRTALSRAASISGLPLWMVQGLAFSESSMNPAAMGDSAHFGLMQLGPGVRHDYGMSVNDAFDPAKNALVGSAYFRKMLDSFPVNDPNRLRHAIIRYKGGGTVADIMAGKVKPLYQQEADQAIADMNAYANVPSGVNASLANAGQANLNAGAYAFNTMGSQVGGSVGDIALYGAGKVDQAATVTVGALDHLAASITTFVNNLLNNSQRIQTSGIGAPMTMRIPQSGMSVAPTRP